MYYITRRRGKKAGFWSGENELKLKAEKRLASCKVFLYNYTRTYVLFGLWGWPIWCFAEEIGMKIGMLWYDRDQKLTIREKINRAARYYARKYGVEPNVCFIHPDLYDCLPRRKGKQNSAENGRSLQVDEIRVRENSRVLPDHYWIGVEGKEG